ncbi:unnamed protein product [Ectocarpus sp. 12 AP-2014]
MAAWSHLVEGFPETYRLIFSSSSSRSNRQFKTGVGKVCYLASPTVLSFLLGGATYSSHVASGGGGGGEGSIAIASRRWPTPHPPSCKLHRSPCSTREDRWR